MGELDAIGEVLTGGLVSRAVEPGAGEVGADGHTHERNCLNCQSDLKGDFCHVCGQHAHVHRTLSAFFHDLLHGVLHFEGKTWRTLPMLAWHPGDLTRRYIAGERAKFVSPMALFLFSVFLMFAVASFTHTFEDSASDEAVSDLQKEVAAANTKVERLQADHDKAIRAGHATKAIDTKLTDAQQELAVLKGLQSGALVGRKDLGSDNEAPGWLKNAVEKVGENPELAFYKFKTSAYKFSWALIPISVPFLWLLFPFSRRYRLYDHTVFVTYSLAFMSLLMIVGMILGSIGLEALAGFLFFVPPFHFYRQLRGAYGLGRFGGIWRAALLTVFAAMALGLFAASLFGFGLFG